MSSAASLFIARLMTLTLAAVLGAYWLALHFGVHAPPIFAPFTVLFLAAVFFGGAFALAGYVLWLAIQHEPRPLRRVARLSVWSPQFLAQRLLPAALTLVFLGAFGSFKSLIPYMHPFAWDTTLSDLDRL